MIASDGLWDTMSGKQCAKLVHSKQVQQAAQLLVNTAHKKVKLFTNIDQLCVSLREPARACASLREPARACVSLRARVCAWATLHV